MPGDVLSIEGLGVGEYRTFYLGRRAKFFQPAQIPLGKAMVSGRLDDVLDIGKVGRIVFSPGWHVANGWQHSVVAGFYNHGLGKKDTNPVS